MTFSERKGKFQEFSGGPAAQARKHQIHSGGIMATLRHSEHVDNSFKEILGRGGACRDAKAAHTREIKRAHLLERVHLSPPFLSGW